MFFRDAVALGLVGRRILDVVFKDRVLKTLLLNSLSLFFWETHDS